MSDGSEAVRGRLAALNRALRGMFRAMETRPIPDRLRSVVDQLDEPQTKPAKKVG